MRAYMAPSGSQADMPDETDTESLSPRRRRLMFRAALRGTKEADLLIGRFVRRGIADFSETELDELEQVLELPDVDLADWLSGRRAIPSHLSTPMLERMAVECGASGAGLPPELRDAADERMAKGPAGLNRLRD